MIEILWLTALVALMLLAVTVRWWIAPSLVGATVVVGFVSLAVRQTLEPAKEFAVLFYTWIQGGALEHALFTSEKALLLYKALVLLGVGLVVLLLLEQLFSMIAITLISFVVLVIMYFLDSSLIGPSILLVAFGLIVLLPRVYVRHIRSSETEERRYRAAMQLTAIPCALLVTLSTLYVVPQNTMSWRWNAFSDLLYDLGYYIEGPGTMAPGKQSYFSLASLGFGSEGELLGGPAYLEKTEALHVISDTPLLLRGRVYDEYTGSNWQVSRQGDGDFRFNRFFFSSERNAALGRNMPLGGRKGKEAFAKVTKEVHFSYEYRYRDSNSIFIAGQPSTVKIKPKDYNRLLFFNRRGEAYLPDAVPRLTQVEQTTRIFLPHTMETQADYLQLEQIVSTTEDPNFQSILGRYTALPKEYSPFVMEKALSVTKPGDTPYQKAVLLAEWLRQHGEYTLLPAEVPEGEDFVAHFLETQQGYCTYFASAMTVMARAAGIPARYVTGFALEDALDREPFDYRATGETAHAWSELYFQGIGWVPFDVLEWDSAMPLNRQAPEKPEEPSAEQGDFPFEPEEPDVKPEQDQNLGEEALALEKSKTSWIAPTLFAAVFVGAVVFYYLDSYQRQSRRFSYQRVLRQTSSLSQAFAYYYDDIIRQLELYGIDILPGETLLEFPKRVDARIILPKENFSEIATVQMNLHYAEILPSKEDVHAAFVYHQLLEQQLVEKLSRPAYFIHRGIKR